MSETTIPRHFAYDKFTFVTRSWLNVLVILLAIIKLHLQRLPVTWAVDVLATVLVTTLLVPAWGVYRLAALLTTGLAVVTIGARRWAAQALRDLVTILGLVVLVFLAGLWLLANKLEP